MRRKPSRPVRGSFSRLAGLLSVPFVLSAVPGSAQPQSLFGPPAFFAAGNQPIAIVSGDLNADQIPDLVIANFLQENVAVLLGVGDGSFGAPTFYGVGGRPDAVAAADLNGDRILDLVAPHGGMTGRVSVLLGIGDGTFAPRTSNLVGAAPSSVAIADLNGDRIADLAVADEASSDVAILLGVGDGTFGPASFYASGSMPKDVAIADLNGDQIPDLATAAMNADRVGVLLGLGDGTFGPPAFYVVGDQPWSLSIGDLNDDEALDLAVANPGYAGPDNICVLLGVGNGTFQPATFYDVGDGPCSIAMADFYSDGVLDVVFVNKYWDDVGVMLGNGNGTLDTASYYPAGDGTRDLVVGDFDGNQILDLAVADSDADCIAILLGNTNEAEVDGPPDAPLLSRLSSVGPNPLSVWTAIDFVLSEPVRAQLRVFDANGRLVSSLLDQDCPAGRNRVVWDLSQGGATHVPTGTYFLTLDTQSHRGVRRITVVR